MTIWLKMLSKCHILILKRPVYYHICVVRYVFYFIHLSKITCFIGFKKISGLIYKFSKIGTMSM